jgi:hypothetical protein
MTDRELMQMALDSIVYYAGGEDNLYGEDKDLLKALRDRLAQPEPEPVAWNGECVLGHCGSPSGCDDSGCCRAAPPSIEAAVLAEREACAEICENIYQGDDITRDWLEDAAAAIRKRGEK